MTREEAIKRLNIHKSTNVFVDSIAEAIDMAIEALSKAEPSADRPSGEWYQIKDHKVMGEGYLWHCSICDYKVYQDSSADYPSENYCPNCGARMENTK